MTARVLLLIVGILANSLTLADPPRTLSYQGTLIDNTGQPVTGVRTITFALYDQPTGGTAWWDVTKDVQIVDGRFSVILENPSKPLPVDRFTGTTYIGVKVADDNAEMPRQQLTSVAYALHALNSFSGTIDGSQITGTVPGSKIGSGINGANITDGTIASSQLRYNNIQGDRLATGSVTTTQIADNSVTGTDIANGTITAADIAANTIEAAQIKDQTITSSKLEFQLLTAIFANPSIDVAWLSTSKNMTLDGGDQDYAEVQCSGGSTGGYAAVGGGGYLEGGTRRVALAYSYPPAYSTTKPYAWRVGFLNTTEGVRKNVTATVYVICVKGY